MGSALQCVPAAELGTCIRVVFLDELGVQHESVTYTSKSEEDFLARRVEIREGLSLLYLALGWELLSVVVKAEAPEAVLPELVDVPRRGPGVMAEHLRLIIGGLAAPGVASWLLGWETILLHWLFVPMSGTFA